MTYVLDSTFITEEQLQQKVVEIGAKIRKDFHGEEIILIVVLKGGFVFAADLLRELEGEDIEIDFVAVSSYGKQTVSTGEVQLIKDISLDITGKSVILVDDIIDSGLTLSFLKEHYKLQRPKSIKICTMLNKQERRIVDVDVDYGGFVIPDKFIVGYGMDIAEKYRNLPYISTIKEV